MKAHFLNFTGLTAILLVFPLSGCAPKRLPTDSEMRLPASVVETQINQSANLIHNDLQKLRSIREASAPVVQPHATPKNGPLAQKVTLKFTGPAHQVVKTIAQLIGYQYKTVGRNPTPPRIVSVDVNGEVAFRAIEDIALQLGENAGVGLDPGQRLLTVDYSGKSN